MSDIHVAEFEHHRVSLLLPWWINGTLDKYDQQLVERHISSCTICQEDCNVLRLCLDSNITEPETTPDVNDAFTNVMQRIDVYEDRGKVGVADAFTEPTMAEEISTAGSKQWPSAQLTGTLSMAAAVVLLFTTVLLTRSIPDPVVSDGQYHVLSSSTASADDLYLEVSFLDQRATRDGVSQLQKSMDDPNAIIGWEKTDDMTLLFRIAATTSPETLSQVLNQLSESDAVNKAALVTH